MKSVIIYLPLGGMITHTEGTANCTSIYDKSGTIMCIEVNFKDGSTIKYYGMPYQFNTKSEKK